MLRTITVLLIGVCIGVVAATLSTGSETSVLKRARALCSEYIVGQFKPVARDVVVQRVKRVAIVAVGALGLWLAGLLCLRSYILVAPNPTAKPDWYDARPASREGLIVVVHGWTCRAEDMRLVAEAARGVFPQHAIRMWEYDASRFSNEDPEGLAIRLGKEIGDRHKEVGGEIILIGHSLGGLLLRRAYIDGTTNSDGWYTSVSRIVLLAAPNRGTRAIYRSRFLWVADMLARSYRAGRLIRSTYRGSPFVVNLRLDWLERFRDLNNPPLVAQVLGGDDGVVSAHDSRDVLQFPTAVERLVPGIDHASIIEHDDGIHALTEVLALERDTTHVARDARNVSKKPERVFKALLLHGIRDYAERFDELQGKVEDAARAKGLEPIVRSPRYEYFSALQFITPLFRRLKIYEFADVYAELRATEPADAPIHFAGHSFGTYLLVKSLQDYSKMRFDRVYLAGSVVEEAFEWEELTGEGAGWQWGFIRNDTALNDWPVGFLCSGLHGLRLADSIGTGGFNGFTRGLTAANSIQNHHLPGGHGHAFDEHLDDIARWLTAEETTMGALDKARLGLVSSRTGALAFLSRAAPMIFLIVFFLFGYVALFGAHPALAFVEALALLWVLSVL